MPPTASLHEGDLEVVGRLTDASNATLYALLGPERVPVVYKPMAGERPLWDFERGTLHRREVATYLLDQALGFDLVPETVLREALTGSGARAFAKRALAVVAAGRPPCPFCTEPLDPSGHVCPRANGYRR